MKELGIQLRCTFYSSRAQEMAEENGLYGAVGCKSIVRD